MSAHDVRAALRTEVRRCLDEHVDVRPYLVENGGEARIDKALWGTLTGQMGLAGLLVPEADGGSGAAVADLAVVFEELGAALAPVPMFSTAGLVLPVLRAVEKSEPVRDLLAGIASGSTVATLALHEADGRYSPEATSARAERDGTGWVLSGTKSFVTDAAAADVLVVPARVEAGIGLVAVPAADARTRTASGRSSSVRITTMTSLDLLRPLATVEFDRAPAQVLAGPDVALQLGSGLDIALILLAAEQVGGAQRCLDNAVSYAKNRVQFGRPIGSFQAIKHQLVDLLLEVELARSALTHAVRTADEYLQDPSPATAGALAEGASLARALCSETYTHVADEALHIHGGIGFTWEHDSHLYYRRAKAAQLLFGNPDEHRERLAVAAGL
ncbi:acyl-CoA dehydrogenase family protein [Thermocrispum municipale]|uniref:acyl-CoA dehydrogenase family protein n=1 Tax=Thermocrispum municipale TaxID=37926 RepID=UPI0003F5B8E4|nr:acyl-CoA dehydrogenase family protein [Thermocrispum municipale]